jgi:biopolymer transport protein ExbD
MLVPAHNFYGTAPMMEQKVPIDLPKTDKVDILTQSEDRYVLTIDKDSKIYFKGSEIPLDALEYNEFIKGNGRSLSLRRQNASVRGVR